MDQRDGLSVKNPFLRPWLRQYGAAAAPGGKGNIGFKGIIAGGITGGIEICITFPTEYVKTQLQLDEKGDRKKYDGIVDCVKKTVKRYGFFGLYRGLSVLLLGSVPKSAVRFGAFETFKNRIKKPDGTLSPVGRMLCGLGAGVSEAILVVTPMETIKVKFINDQRSAEPRFKGLIRGVATIIKEEGLGGTYKGMTATVLRQGTNQATRFFIMETFKDYYRGGDINVIIPKPIIGIFGAFAGLCSVYVNNPVDVVKTRMQGLEAKMYKNTWDCAVRVFTNEGPRAFYKGVVPRLGRVCLDVAITFMIYDSIQELFAKYW
uniref:Citrate transport protein n=1 Tax=Diabrotica virgifera virgifera TaxID=50390 RepID=A0A6P7GMB4_DIAVI